MFLTTTKTSSRYESLAASLTQHIDGQAVGQKLPSVRDLMNKFSVSQATVDKSLSLLVDNGLVERIQGKGAFISDRSNKLLQVEMCFFFSQDVIDNPLYSEITARILLSAQSHNMHLSVFVYTSWRGSLNCRSVLVARSFFHY